jgi:hypothetical protein
VISRQQEAYLGDAELSPVGVPAGVSTATVSRGDGAGGGHEGNSKGETCNVGFNAGEDGEDTRPSGGSCC